ncbi:unnamed protein product [Acanthosepion pharaonis]|uniref:Tetratricopeptide repeat protein 29 n=1 Tax=Acanthosepion pharaonis TaxID=158019 RepID=A0A812EKZ0_ACAPH|nr:unnamed protein product [Sepia pharaonis]
MASAVDTSMSRMFRRLTRRDQSFLMRPPVHGRKLLQPMKMPTNKRERDLLEKQVYLRENLPVLNKKETANYWKSFKHSLCVDLLASGFHLSFDEIFNLIQEQKKRISPYEKKQTLLEEEKDKLNIIKKQLMEAESAMLAENYRLAYEARLVLANHFSNEEDKWLSDHFRETCLEVSCLVDSDEGKTYAEGYCNMALALKDSGEYLMAMEKLEWYYELTAGREWTNDEGLNLHQQASSYLFQIYTFIAMKKKESGYTEEALLYLQKAYERAVEAKDQNDIGEAIYKLGLAYLDAKDPDVALEHLKKFMEISEKLHSAYGMGRAANGIASAYEMKGNMDICMTYLRMYVDIAEKNGLEQAYSTACHHLGSICNSLAIHDEAVEWFSKAYNISRALNDYQSLGANRVQFGTALAHKMNVIYISNVKMPNIEALLKWKSFRAEEFISEENEVENHTETNAEDLFSDKKKEPSETGNEPTENVSHDANVITSKCYLSSGKKRAAVIVTSTRHILQSSGFKQHFFFTLLFHIPYTVCKSDKTFSNYYVILRESPFLSDEVNLPIQQWWGLLNCG